MELVPSFLHICAGRWGNPSPPNMHLPEGKISTPSLHQIFQGPDFITLFWGTLIPGPHSNTLISLCQYCTTILVRRLNSNDLGHLIHFITGHNHLLRHKCTLDGGGDDTSRLCGVGREDAVHLWAECSVKSCPVDGNPTMGSDTWSGFLREPLVAGLPGQVWTEHPSYPPHPGKARCRCLCLPSFIKIGPLVWP